MGTSEAAEFTSTQSSTVTSQPVAFDVYGDDLSPEETAQQAAREEEERQRNEQNARHVVSNTRKRVGEGHNSKDYFNLTLPHFPSLHEHNLSHTKYSLMQTVLVKQLYWHELHVLYMSCSNCLYCQWGGGGPILGVNPKEKVNVIHCPRLYWKRKHMVGECIDQTGIL